MARFKSNNLLLADDQKIQLGDNQEAELTYDNDTYKLTLSVDVGTSGSGLEIVDSGSDGNITFITDSSDRMNISSGGQIAFGDLAGTYYTFPTSAPSADGRFLYRSAANTLSWSAYSLPTSDGSSGQYLSTNGSGSLSWGDAPSSFQIKDTDSDTFIRVEASSGNDDDYFYGEISDGTTGHRSLYLDSSSNYNTILGYNSGGSLDLLSGTQRLILGSYSARALTTASDVVVVGVNSANAITTNGSAFIGGTSIANSATSLLQSVLIGQNIYPSGSTASNNVLIGYDVVNSATSSVVDSVIIGSGAGAGMDTANSDVLIGRSAGQFSSGTYTIAIGYSAFSGVSTADRSASDDSVYIGHNAGKYLSSGSNNVALGTLAFAGDSANKSHSTYSVVIGSNAGRYLSGNTNTIVGPYAAQGMATSFVSGTQNLALGYAALRYASTASNSIAIGYSALGGTTSVHLTGAYNIAIGYSAGTRCTTATQNVFIGSYAGGGTTNTGQYNIGIGYRALSGVTSGQRNIALGEQALESTSNLAGSDNIAAGYRAGYHITSGARNILLGYWNSLELTTGSNNIFLGVQTGRTVTTGSYNVYLGYNMQGGSASESYKFRLGYNNRPTIYVDMQNYVVTFGDYVGGTSYTFPAARGTSDQILKTDGSGQLSWTSYTASPWVTVSNVDIDSAATEDVDSFDPSGDGSVVWFYHIEGPNTGATNFRTGQVMAVWDDSAGTAQYTETSTLDIGSTSDVTLSVDMSAALGNVRLRATVLSDNWSITVKRMQIK